MIKHSVIALAVLATSATAALADSVDVRVIGTIVPAACTPTLSGGGTVDYGTIKAQSLNATGYTTLAEKQLDFAINCDSPTKVSIGGYNRRSGSMAGATESGNLTGRMPVTVFGMSGVGGVGLGLDGSAKIGGYSMRLVESTLTADGNAVRLLARTGGGAPWAVPATREIFFDPTWSRALTPGESTTLAPLAFNTMNVKLGVQAYINQRSQLDLTKPIHLDGLTSIEVSYL